MADKMFRLRRSKDQTSKDQLEHEQELASREGISAHGESLWAVYRRRFKKHTLGKIGFAILIVLYGFALFADVLSPYTMSWNDKKKSYHPPAEIVWKFTDETGATRFKPFVYESVLTNVAFKEYKVVPSYTIRAISQETRVGKRELRSITYDQNPAVRADTTVKSVMNYYNLPVDGEDAAGLREALAALEASPKKDQTIPYVIQERSETNPEQQLVYLVKGNKNFLGLFSRGVPYSFLGLFDATRHVFGSRTGGVYFLGADDQGRDLLSRMLHGARVSLSVGIIGALLTFIFGLTIGGLAGYFGGKVDTILMAFPSVYLLFALRASFPSSMTSTQVYLMIVIILSFIGWAGLARIIRGLVLSLKNEDFVLSAKTMGLSNWKIIRRHILPNTLSFVIIQATLTIPGYILGESALSLLGLGINEPQSSWGLMLSAAKNYGVINNFPWILIPGFAIFLAIMAWNFFGDGIRDAVDPRSKF